MYLTELLSLFLLNLRKFTIGLNVDDYSEHVDKVIKHLHTKNIVYTSDILSPISEMLCIEYESVLNIPVNYLLLSSISDQAKYSDLLTRFFSADPDFCKNQLTKIEDANCPEKSVNLGNIAFLCLNAIGSDNEETTTIRNQYQEIMNIIIRYHI